jgi:drug/metabolite transporter (DMT)-like permease
MPLMTAILAALILKEAFTPRKRVGFAFIVGGIVLIVWGSGISFATSQTIGHVLFLGSALAFACYTIALRWARLDGLHAAAISAVGSMLLFLPPYSLVAGASVFDASMSAIGLQALVQGCSPQSSPTSFMGVPLASSARRAVQLLPPLALRLRHSWLFQSSANGRPASTGSRSC